MKKFYQNQKIMKQLIKDFINKMTIYKFNKRINKLS